MEEDHDLADHLLFRPGILDQSPAHRANAFDILQPGRLLLDNIENFLAEFMDQLFGISWPDAFDHAAAQIFLDAFFGSRSCAGERVGAELEAELAVALPASLRRQPFARGHG